MIKTSKIWEEYLQENEQALSQILKSSGKDISKEEVEFRSSFQDKQCALDARKSIIETFSDNDMHVFIMNNDDDLSYDCILSKKIHVTAEAITEIELGMTTECQKYGGEPVSWEFLSSGISIN